MQKVDINVTQSWIFLFIPQGIDGVGCGGFDGLETNGEKSDDQRHGRSQGEYPQTHIYPVRKILKPFVHDKVGNRPGDKIGDCNKKKEIFWHQPHNIRNSRPECFSDAKGVLHLRLFPGEVRNKLPSFKIYYNLYPIIIILLVIQMKTRELITIRV